MTSRPSTHEDLRMVTEGRYRTKALREGALIRVRMRPERQTYLPEVVHAYSPSHRLLVRAVPQQMHQLGKDEKEEDHRQHSHNPCGRRFHLSCINAAVKARAI